MKSMIAVSVVVPVRNEEAGLPACLSRLSCFDEVVVVDSGSDDATCEVSARFGARVIQFSWNGEYPKKRNWALLNLQFANEWVLFLDADELVSEEFCDELEQALAAKCYNGFWLRYTNHFLGKPLRHGDPQRKLALFRVGKGLFERIEEDNWSGLDMEVHEHPIIDGAIGEIRTPIDHRDDRGIARFVDRHSDYAMWEARRTLALREDGEVASERLTDRQRTKYRNIDKWWFAFGYFFSSYVLRRGFLDGAAGFSYAFYKLWYFWTVRLLIRERTSQNP